MAIWKCLKCGTKILQNYEEKCEGCGGDVLHESGHIKDEKTEIIRNKRKGQK